MTASVAAMAAALAPLHWTAQVVAVFFLGVAGLTVTALVVLLVIALFSGG